MKTSTLSIDGVPIATLESGVAKQLLELAKRAPGECRTIRMSSRQPVPVYRDLNGRFDFKGMERPVDASLHLVFTDHAEH